MKQPNTLPELLRHAADLAEKGESLAGRFEDKDHTGQWHRHGSNILPAFTDGGEWRVVDQDQPDVALDFTCQIPDEKPTYDMSIHSNTDPSAWAKFYCESNKAADFDMMLGWFANAMMAIHDSMSADKNAAPEDQHLLDDGWIRHTGDGCPVHPKTKVEVMLMDNQLMFKGDANDFYWRKDLPLRIIQYKVIKEYVEPTTFEMKVGDKVFVLNKPYMRAPEHNVLYFYVHHSSKIYKTAWNFSGDSADREALQNHNCWKTENDAKAYAEAKLARNNFELGEIK
jgi:hypothetical protein